MFREGHRHRPGKPCDDPTQHYYKKPRTGGYPTAPKGFKWEKAANALENSYTREAEESP